MENMKSREIATGIALTTVFAVGGCSGAEQPKPQGQTLIQPCDNPDVRALYDQVRAVSGDVAIEGFLRIKNDGKIRTGTVISNNVAWRVKTGDDSKCVFVPITKELPYPDVDNDGKWFQVSGSELADAGMMPKKSDENDFYWVNEQKATMFCAGPTEQEPKCINAPWIGNVE